MMTPSAPRYEPLVSVRKRSWPAVSMSVSFTTCPLTSSVLYFCQVLRAFVCEHVLAESPPIPQKKSAATNGLKVWLLLLKRVLGVAHEDACLAHAGVANEQNPNHTAASPPKEPIVV